MSAPDAIANNIRYTQLSNSQDPNNSNVSYISQVQSSPDLPDNDYNSRNRTAYTLRFTRTAQLLEADPENKSHFNFLFFNDQNILDQQKFNPDHNGETYRTNRAITRLEFLPMGEIDTPAFQPTMRLQARNFVHIWPRQADNSLVPDCTFEVEADCKTSDDNVEQKTYFLTLRVIDTRSVEEGGQRPEAEENSASSSPHPATCCIIC